MNYLQSDEQRRQSSCKDLKQEHSFVASFSRKTRSSCLLTVVGKWLSLSYMITRHVRDTSSYFFFHFFVIGSCGYCFAIMFLSPLNFVSFFLAYKSWSRESLVRVAPWFPSFIRFWWQFFVMKSLPLYSRTSCCLILLWFTHKCSFQIHPLFLGSLLWCLRKWILIHLPHDVSRLSVSVLERILEEKEWHKFSRRTGLLLFLELNLMIIVKSFLFTVCVPCLALLAFPSQICSKWSCLAETLQW